MEFSRQEYWSGLPFNSPGGLLDPGIEPSSPALQEVSLASEPLQTAQIWCVYIHPKNVILLGHKKESNFAICSNMYGLGGYYAK